MFLGDIPDDSTTFVDANIFIYSISGHPGYGNSCSGFLNRVKRGEIGGVTSVIVLNELLHKLILGEIAEKRSLKLSQVAGIIRKNPEILKDLRSYKIIENIESETNLSILDARSQNFKQARRFMKEHSLLSNDALHLAVMKDNNLVNLASNDSDFENIEWIRTYKPAEE